MVETHAALD
jgi:hypothetical protein